MNTPKPARQSATPKQQRSRESHERVVAATRRLLLEEKGADFTLADVSRESGVSIGGIYGRFDNRMALIQEVQLRTNEAMAAEYTLKIEQARKECSSGRELMRRLVVEIAESLRRHKGIIKAIVDASLSDPQIAQQGLHAYASQLALFKAALLDHAADIAHPDREQAIDFCFLSVYELVASHFGFGRRRSAEDAQWEQLLAQLQHLCVAFLTTPPEPQDQPKRPAGRPKNE
jgi:AcrR family transcriptional regulator